MVAGFEPLDVLHATALLLEMTAACSAAAPLNRAVNMNRATAPVTSKPATLRKR